MRILAGDMWSFGCVLTELATWIVGGCSAVKQFSAARLAHSRRKRSCRNSRCIGGGAFHCGNTLLPEVQQWCEAILQNPNTDSITRKILALTMEKMLVHSFENRISASEAQQTLESIIQFDGNTASVLSYDGCDRASPQSGTSVFGTMTLPVNAQYRYWI